MFLNTYSLDGRSNEYFERWSPDGASVRNFTLGYLRPVLIVGFCVPL